MTATIFVSWQCAGDGRKVARIRDEDSIRPPAQARAATIMSAVAVPEDRERAPVVAHIVEAEPVLGVRRQERVNGHHGVLNARAECRRYCGATNARRRSDRGGAWRGASGSP